MSQEFYERRWKVIKVLLSLLISGAIFYVIVWHRDLWWPYAPIGQ